MSENMIPGYDYSINYNSPGDLEVRSVVKVLDEKVVIKTSEIKFQIGEPRCVTLNIINK
tara:strand:+ start:341 stop:517 length:177 start_codon:yes stop_codon:yes gene_type:complete